MGVSLRKQIRENIVGLLAGRTRAGRNVRANRGEVHESETLPAISVYLGPENITPMDSAPRRISRIMETRVELIDSGSDLGELSDKLDDLAEQVEVCLSVDDSLGRCADDIILNSITELEADSVGEKVFGSLRLIYDVRYHTFSPRSIDDQPNVGDFEGLDSEWQVGHHDEDPTMAEADRAKDVVNFP